MAEKEVLAMALEIERKFLVDAKKIAALNLTGGEKISQGYLCTEPTVRVRTKGARAFLTVKSANDGLIRHEYEYEIPVADAVEMLKLCAPRTLEKTRYKIEHGGKIWELDIFEGRHAGLILAEVELDSAEEKVELPEWIGAEVSDDERYYNSRLALDN